MPGEGEHAGGEEPALPPRKQALDGEEVVIASTGEPMVRLVPVTAKRRLRGSGKLKKLAAAVDDAFTRRSTRRWRGV